VCRGRKPPRKRARFSRRATATGVNSATACTSKSIKWKGDRGMRSVLPGRGAAELRPFFRFECSERDSMAASFPRMSDAQPSLTVRVRRCTIHAGRVRWDILEDGAPLVGPESFATRAEAEAAGRAELEKMASTPPG
jgi:hypothetical protein